MNWSIRQAAFCSVLDTSLKDSLFSSKTMHVFDMSFDRINENKNGINKGTFISIKI